MSHEEYMSYVNVWGCTGNLEHTQHLIEKGGVLEMFCRINLDYFEGYTVTGSRVSSPCVIRPSPLSALRIMAQLANSFASFACTR